MTIDCTSVPKHLKVMRSITGIEETPGSGDNPKIMGMRDWIACTYEDMKNYCEGYTGDDVAWCGLATGFCCTVAGIRPPYDPEDDTGSFLWAQSFANDNGFEHQTEPCLGTIVVMTRSGGGHVTMFEGWVSPGHTFKARGGNQSDAINVQTYDASDVIAWVWPRGVPLPAPGPTPDPGHPELEKGDTGPAVVEVQRILGLPQDGDFGSITESGVMQFQGACDDLDADGCVGPMTWAELDDLDRKMREGEEGLGASLEEQIEEICSDSPVNGYDWPNRGEAPSGYYVGMAKSFAWALQNMNDDAVVIMQAKATTNDSDALAVYAKELKAADIDTSKNGIDTLRGLFVLMTGLGMRESSGNHWEGRDMSADNVQSDTCEAGLFQTSWDIAPASSAIPPLLEVFWDDPNGFRPDFDVGVSPTATNLDAYGSGDGARYQFLAKYSPLFHVLVTGVGMRKRCSHWGPINRKEVDIVGMVDDLLIEVERAVENA